MAALLLDALLVGILIDLLHHLFNLELLVLAVYGAAMWKLRGSTIGGIVFDLQVVRQDGREIDWATAIVRALACFLSLAAAGLGFIWIAFDDGKQAFVFSSGLDHFRKSLRKQPAISFFIQNSCIHCFQSPSSYSAWVVTRLI